MADSGHHCLPALLDYLSVCTAADNQDRLGCLRGDRRFWTGVPAFALCRNALY